MPFTLQGLSEVEGLENADIIVYWPSPDLFDPKVIARELTQHARILDDKSKEKWVLGLKLTRHVVTQDVYGEAYAKELGITTFGSALTPDGSEGKPGQKYIAAFTLEPRKGDPCPLLRLLPAIQNHLAFFHDNMPVTKSQWAKYTKATGYKSPTEFLKIVLCHVMGPSFAAAYRGAAVAIVVPPGLLPKAAKTWKISPLFKSAYAWLSPLICVRFPGKGTAGAIASPVAQGKAHFSMLKDWSKIECKPKIIFAVARGMSDESVDAFTEGFLRPNEFAPIPLMHHPYVQQPAPKDPISQHQENPADKIEELIHLYPARTDQEGNALSLTFKYGAGGLVLMTVPRSPETLLGIATKRDPIKKIELTNEQPRDKGPKAYFLVRVTLASGEKVEVPLVPETFMRLLAFCVAAKLALRTGTDSHGHIDVTTMIVAGHDLGSVAEPIAKEHPAKMRQSINNAISDELPPGVDCNIVSKSAGSRKYSLNSNLWKAVDIAHLQKLYRKPQENQSIDDAAIQKIIAVLN